MTVGVPSMRRRLVTRSTAAVTVTALALGLGACTSDSKESAPVVAVTGAKLTSLRAAGDSLQEAGSARFTMEVSGDGVNMKSSGVVDTKAAATEMNMEMQVAGKNVTMTERLVDGVVYMKSDLFSKLGMGGWLKVDLSAAGIDAKELGQLGDTSQSDPAGQTQFLNGLDDVQKVGTDEINGAPTTHYKGVANLNKALQQVEDKVGTDSDAAASVRKAIGQVGGGTTIPVEVWIDAENRPVKMTMTMIVGGKTLTTTMTYSDFGTPVSVEAPPADEVQDFSSLMSRTGLAS